MKGLLRSVGDGRAAVLLDSKHPYGVQGDKDALSAASAPTAAATDPPFDTIVNASQRLVHYTAGRAVPRAVTLNGLDSLWLRMQRQWPQRSALIRLTRCTGPPGEKQHKRHGQDANKGEVARPRLQLTLSMSCS